MEKSEVQQLKHILCPKIFKHWVNVLSYSIMGTAEQKGKSLNLMIGLAVIQYKTDLLMFSKADSGINPALKRIGVSLETKLLGDQQGRV